MPTKTYPNTYVANLDLLGFKDLVTNNSHEELMKIYTMLTEHVAQSVALYRFNKEESVAGVSIKPKLSDVQINSMVISDSVILWSNDTSVRSFFDMVVTVWNMLSFGVFLGIPMRGGLVVGPITIINEKLASNADNQQITFVGKAIVDSHVLEQQQQWSGCVVSKESLAAYGSALEQELKTTSDPKRLMRAVSVESLIARGFIIEYDVPFKDGKRKEMVINWPRLMNPRLSDGTVANSFYQHKKKPQDKYSLAKIENTMDFLRITPDGQREEIRLK